MTTHKKILLSALIVAIFGMALPALADEYSDVNRLIKSNQMSEALSKADQFLTQKPRDPQMRFMRGVILSETGRTNEAISSFTRLTEDYPELPEPYNNLAVIYAATGQFEKAKNALEMAIKTNPSYSTAHENLGDIYARLASQAYAKALQLDGANTAVPPKLALIRELFAPVQAGKPSAQAANRPVASAPPAPVAPQPAPTVVSPVVAPIAPPAPTVVTAAPSGSNQPSVAPKVVANAVTGRDVEAAVDTWAKAWAARDMQGYLASYNKDFKPANNLNRAAWEEERKTRIMGKAKISVKLSDISVNVTGNTAIAKFKQDYKADALSASSRKTLEMVKVGDRWQITKEVSG
jgi:tetratricopeptide (TPR) repeat protein